MAAANAPRTLERGVPLPVQSAIQSWYIPAAAITTAIAVVRSRRAGMATLRKKIAEQPKGIAPSVSAKSPAMMAVGMPAKHPNTSSIGGFAPMIATDMSCAAAKTTRPSMAAQMRVSSAFTMYENLLQ